MANPAASPAVQDDPVSVAKMCYWAYMDKDRSVIEQLIADDFHFTSPLDNRIDRNTYFERCWPNSANTADFKFVHLLQHGERVFVTYEGRNTSGESFRNTEILTVRHGKLVDAELRPSTSSAVRSWKTAYRHSDQEAARSQASSFPRSRSIQH